MSPSRHRVLVRTLSILRAMEAGGRYTLRRLAVEHHVCERTIRRDLEAMQQAGFPIGRTPDTGEGLPGLYWLQKP
jgi:predicted DNA-binding transcriptional regulator YafY